MFQIEDRINRFYRGNANRTGGKPFMLVGVVWGIHVEIRLVQTLYREIFKRVFHGRVSLKGHAGKQPVIVQARYTRLLGIVCCLFFNYRSQCYDLFLREVQLAGFPFPVCIPKIVRL